nr:MAG TPA: hypothetical protein [Caudoviricetes sp.]
MGCGPHRRLRRTRAAPARPSRQAPRPATTRTMAAAASAQLWMIAKRSRSSPKEGRKKCIINIQRGSHPSRRGKYKITDAKAS